MYLYVECLESCMMGWCGWSKIWTMNEECRVTRLDYLMTEVGVVVVVASSSGCDVLLGSKWTCDMVTPGRSELITRRLEGLAVMVTESQASSSLLSTSHCHATSAFFKKLLISKDLWPLFPYFCHHHYLQPSLPTNITLIITATTQKLSSTLPKNLTHLSFTYIPINNTAFTH